MGFDKQGTSLQILISNAGYGQQLLRKLATTDRAQIWSAPGAFSLSATKP
jgi:hypothetical protein